MGRPAVSPRGLDGRRSLDRRRRRLRLALRRRTAPRSPGGDAAVAAGDDRSRARRRDRHAAAPVCGLRARRPLGVADAAYPPWRQPRRHRVDRPGDRRQHGGLQRRQCVPLAIVGQPGDRRSGPRARRLRGARAAARRARLHDGELRSVATRQHGVRCDGGRYRERTRRSSSMAVRNAWPRAW